MTFQAINEGVNVNKVLFLKTLFALFTLAVLWDRLPKIDQLQRAYYAKDIMTESTPVNPLSHGVKLQILLSCHHTFVTKAVGRSC